MRWILPLPPLISSAFKLTFLWAGDMLTNASLSVPWGRIIFRPQGGTMRNYEFTVIFDANEEKMKEGLQLVTDTLKDAGAEITKQDDMGVRTLAYLINKQDKGHYVYFELSVEPDKIAPMSHIFQLSTLILKFLFVNPEK